MKKFLSIVLAVIMIASVMPMAFAADYEIALNETITITAPSDGTNEFAVIKFVPEKDGKYALRSYAEEGADPFCMIYDADMNYLGENDDFYGLDFFAKYDFVAGETYYFSVLVYSDEALEIDVALVCAHIYSGNICTICGKECTHEMREDIPVICECGEVFDGIEFKAGDEKTYQMPGTDPVWGRFIPEADGVYCMETVTEGDAIDSYGIILNSDLEEIAFNDDYDETLNFRLRYKLEAGETYYLCIGSYYEDAEIDFRLQRMSHVTDAGEIHMDFDVVEETYSNCTEHGYSEGVFCNECEEFIEGHEECDLEPDWHVDDDWDDICDLCDAELEYYYFCECICHYEDGFFAFIWRIANFFHSAVGIFPECECGEWHY